MDHGKQFRLVKVSLTQKPLIEYKNIMSLCNLLKLTPIKVYIAI